MEEKILELGKSKDLRIEILKKKCNFLYKLGKPFELTRSGNTYELSSDFMNEKAFKGGFSAKDLQFIRSVKLYVVKHGIASKFVDTVYNSDDVDYMRVKKYEIGERLENLVELDINGAYWETARHLEIISYAIYKKGLEVDKIVRLAALGSLAKVKETWTYDGKKMRYNGSEKSFLTQNLWFAICNRVGNVMRAVEDELGDDFVFYWVDGVYFKQGNDNIAKVSELFLNHGYETKLARIPWVEFHEKGFTVQCALRSKTKEFFWSQTKSNKPLTEIAEKNRLLAIAKQVIWDSEDK